MMNWDKIEQLLNIISKASEHGPNLSPVVQFAQQELSTHVKEAQMQAAEAKVKKDKEEADAAAKLKAESPEEVQRDREDAFDQAQGIEEADPAETSTVRRV
jgi:hypothetical protein